MDYFASFPDHNYLPFTASGDLPFDFASHVQPLLDPVLPSPPAAQPALHAVSVVDVQLSHEDMVYYVQNEDLVDDSISYLKLVITDDDQRATNSNPPQLHLHTGQGQDSKGTIESIILRHVNLVWIPGTFHPLRVLELSNRNRDNAGLPSMYDLRQILAFSPNLEHLSLCNAGPMRNEDSPSAILPPGPCNFPASLRSIYLEREPIDIAYILSNLILPETTNIICKTTFDTSFHDDEIRECLPDDLTGLGIVAHMKTVVFSWGPNVNGSLIEAFIHDDVSPLNISVARTHPHLSIRYEYEDLEDMWDIVNSFAARTIDALPSTFLREITNLHIRCDLLSVEETHWISALEDLHCITHLTFTNYKDTRRAIQPDTGAFLMTLALRAFDAKEPKVLCPQLQHFTLFGLVADTGI
ncbi:unnamed protein product [Somion occarium]|uniref:Uncharacterized protein n=1 Tax=Somion occarium TaxID=3059160 RepID=A0ABP1CXH9_9APHY